ncbi:hypothetical protein BDF21DRAFT_424830 [Thamnidium elegans]|nr:hypothetical protein BDF21DRAFT_424830 [Thamnidium elegans]
MRLLILFIALLLLVFTARDIFISILKIDSEQWKLRPAFTPFLTQLPSCQVCQRQILETKISYYTYKFKIKLISINIIDNWRNYFLPSVTRKDIPKEYVSIQAGLDDYMIRKMVRTKEREAIKSKLDLISWCIEFGSQVTEISKRHGKEWDELIEKWIKYHNTSQSGVGLNEHARILRELNIYFDWTLQMYKHRTLVQKQGKEIGQLKGPEKTINDIEGLGALYEYYENIRLTLVNNTMYMMKNNLDQVSIEIITAFTKSTGALVRSQSMTLKQDKSLYKSKTIKNNIITITINDRFAKLRRDLQELWYRVPKSVLEVYFIPELTGWQKFWHYCKEIYNWVKDWVIERIERNRQRMDKYLYTTLI